MPTHQHDGLHETASAAMDRHAMPCLAVGLVQGRTSDIHCYGLADIASRRAVGPDTVFRIASVSKTITGLAIMQLRDAGKLELDDPVGRHLRHFRVVAPAGAPDITIRHLLTHTSGLGSLRSMRDLLHPRMMAGIGIRAGQRAPDPGEYYGGALRAEGPAGAKWSYSNHAFNVLGSVISDASGESFDDYVRSRILEPFGMLDTTFRRADVDRSRFATGYRRTRRGIVPAPDIDVALPAAGSGFSTAADLCRYAVGLLGAWRGDDDSVVSEATLREMCQPQLGRPAGVGDHGLPFALSAFDGHRVAVHRGGWPGFSTLFVLAPDDDVAVVAWSNRFQPSGVAGNDEVGTVALRSLLGSQPSPSTPTTDDQGEWPEIVGRYTPPPGLNSNMVSLVACGNEVEVRAVDGALTLRSLLGPLAKRVVMRRVSPWVYEFDPPASYAETFSRLAADQPARIVFEPGADGRIRLRGLGGIELVHRDRALGLVSLRRLFR